jgi:very-short-patch-repair endonuclease
VAPRPRSASSKVQRARELREEATRAERALWWRLRDRQIRGAKFRRQHPIAEYIVDFVALEHRLVVELDGGQHAVEPIQSRDAERTKKIEAEGFRMLRFWNPEVLDNLEGVLEEIATWLERGPPHPASPPCAGER